MIEKELLVIISQCQSKLKSSIRRMEEPTPYKPYYLYWGVMKNDDEIINKNNNSAINLSNNYYEKISCEVV